MNIEDKYQKLQNIIKNLGKAAVAFSGGVDSSFLSKVTFDVLGENSAAITVVSPMLPESEIRDAKEIAEFIGISHFMIEDNEIEEEVAENNPDRCYHCKKVEFGNILDAAKAKGIEYVLDGSNRDDMSDYRPGLNALKELKIISPLREAELTKQEIRILSKRLGLKTWDKPAFACLASRIPYGEEITINKLSRVEKGEDYLRSIGLKQFRLRSHGDTARIEVARDEREKLFNVEIMDNISEALKSYGFIYVSMELSGYKMGSMNAVLNREENQ